MRYALRRAAPAAIMSSLLVAGGSAPEQTSVQEPETASTAVVAPPPSSVTTLTPTTSLPAIETPEFIVGGYDSERNAITIAELTPAERATYDRYASPQAAAEAALDLGCRAVLQVWMHKDDVSWNEGVTSEVSQAYDTYTRARSLYEYGQYQIGTLTAKDQFRQALGALGCELPPPEIGDAG